MKSLTLIQNEYNFLRSLADSLFFLSGNGKSKERKQAKREYRKTLRRIELVEAKLFRIADKAIA